MVGREIPQSRGKERQEARHQKLTINSFPGIACMIRAVYTDPLLYYCIIDWCSSQTVPPSTHTADIITGMWRFYLLMVHYFGICSVGVLLIVWVRSQTGTWGSWRRVTLLWLCN